MKLDKESIIPIIYIIGLLIALFVVYKVLGAFGLIKTRASKLKDQAVEDLRLLPQFSPAYQIDKQFKHIPDTLSDILADELFKAVKGAGTNEEAIYSVIGKMYNKSNLSQVAGRYLLRHKRDLRTDLLNDLSDKEKAVMMNLINKLPER